MTSYRIGDVISLKNGDLRPQQYRIASIVAAENTATFTAVPVWYDGGSAAGREVSGD